MYNHNQSQPHQLPASGHHMGFVLEWGLAAATVLQICPQICDNSDITEASLHHCVMTIVTEICNKVLSCYTNKFQLTTRTLSAHMDVCQSEI